MKINKTYKHLKPIIALTPIFFICLISGLLFTSCSLLLGEKSDEELSEDILQYLHNKYDGEFEMTYSHWICNEGNLTSGCPSYELTFINKEMPNRPFWIWVSYANDSMEVMQDDYDELLISLYVENQMNAFLATMCQNCVLGMEVSYIYPESTLNKDSITLYMEQEIDQQSHSTIEIAIIDTNLIENESNYDSLLFATILELNRIHVNTGRIEVHFYNDSINGDIQDLKPTVFTSYPPQHEKVSHIWSLQFDKDYFEKYNILLEPKTIDSLASKRESYY